MHTPKQQYKNMFGVEDRKPLFPLPPVVYTEVQVVEVTEESYKYTRTSDGKELFYVKQLGKKMPPENLIKVMLEKLKSFYAITNPMLARVKHISENGKEKIEYTVLAEHVPSGEAVRCQVQYLCEGLVEGYQLALPKTKPYFFTWRTPKGTRDEYMDPKYYKWKTTTEWFETFEQAEARHKELIDQFYEKNIQIEYATEDGTEFLSYLNCVCFDHEREHHF